MKEIWKDIKGYEGLYQASNLGRIKSLKHIRKNGTKKSFIQKERILKPAIQKESGYQFVVLCRDNNPKGYRVHRLIAETFLSNPNKYRCVNHKDENKANNNLNNLEWCTHKYNNNYGTKKERLRKAHQKTQGRKINQYDLDGNFLKQWNCMMDAERQLKIKRASSGICSCCKNKIKSAHGYKWEYANTL